MISPGAVGASTQNTTGSKAADRRYMDLALTLGRRGLGRTWPNPAVGAVVVKDVPDFALVVGNPARLKRETGWEPEFSFDRTLDDLLEYWRGMD